MQDCRAQLEIGPQADDGAFAVTRALLNGARQCRESCTPEHIAQSLSQGGERRQVRTSLMGTRVDDHGRSPSLSDVLMRRVRLKLLDGFDIRRYPAHVRLAAVVGRRLAHDAPKACSVPNTKTRADGPSFQTLASAS